MFLVLYVDKSMTVLIMLFVLISNIFYYLLHFNKARGFDLIKRFYTRHKKAFIKNIRLLLFNIQDCVKK